MILGYSEHIPLFKQSCERTLCIFNTEAALAHMGANADRVNATLADNDETERFALSPGLWLMARSQASALLHGGYLFKQV